MKITNVEAIPSASPGTNLRGSRSNYVYVKVSTDEGITGWGESTCGPLSVAEFVEEIGATLVGKDAFRIEEHWQRLYHLYHNVRGGVIQMAAISGIEIALWDIKGKALGVPVWELLGGQMRDRIWTYGRFDGATPELAVERALREVETGLTALKGDPFGHQGLFITPAAERDAIAKVKAVRETVGDDVELLVEVHGRLTPAAAIRIGNALEEFRPFVFEEPVPPQNVDAMAKAYYVGIQPHNPYGPINTMAALQVDVCTPNFMIQEGGHAPWFEQVVVGEFPRQKEGYFDVPTAPGIGVEMDEETLRANPPAEQLTPEGYLRGAPWQSKQGNHWI